MKIEYLNEIWRDIKGYEGLYQISNFGRVKSLARVVKWKGVERTIKERILSFNISKFGYLRVFVRINGKGINWLVHKLVAEAFIPNPNNYKYVNHKDENKQNNFVWVNEDGSVDLDKSNLEWCSFEYNCNYGTRNQRISETKKKLHSKGKKIIQYALNGKKINEYTSMIEAANKYNNKSMVSGISQCCRGLISNAYGYIWKYKEIA